MSSEMDQLLLNAQEALEAQKKEKEVQSLVADISKGTVDYLNLSLDDDIVRDALMRVKYTPARLELEDKMLDEEVILFRPTSNDLLNDYPELGKHREFTDLKSRKKLLFVWYYANRTSPLANIGDRPEDNLRRIFKSLQHSGYDNELSTQEIQNYLRGIIPHDVMSAISKMRSFVPSTRMVALKATEKMFNTLILLSQRELPKDVNEQKKVIDIGEKVTKLLPVYLDRLETKFGVVIEKLDSKNGKAPKIVDEVIEETAS